MSHNEGNNQKNTGKDDLTHQNDNDLQDTHDQLEHDDNIDLGGEGENEESKNLDDGKNDENEHDIPQNIQDMDDAMGGEAAQTSEIDDRSVYVKSVDYSATKEEVTDFFKSCGKINRVSIVTDKYTGHPKGFAYIEFADKEGAENAMILSDSTFKGRTITVMPKRTNVPFRGRGGRARRFGRGYFPTVRRGFSMFTMRSMRRGYRPY